MSHVFSVPQQYFKQNMFGPPPTYFGSSASDPYMTNPVISRPPTLKSGGHHTMRSLLPTMLPFGSGPSLLHTPTSILDKPPITTVFVGNISEKAPDFMIKHLLGKCGNVLSWKRVHGASGKLQAFGFCEYEDPESTLRCIRLLHDWTIAEKNLVVKVDPKTQAQLDEYKKKKKEKYASKIAQSSASTEEEKDGGEGDDDDTEEVLDVHIKAEDELVRKQLLDLMEEYADELHKPVDEEEVVAVKEDPKVTESRRRERLEGPKHLTIDDMDLDNDRKDLINREIETFRQRHKDVDMDRSHREEEMRRRYQEKERREKERLRRGLTGSGGGAGGGGGGGDASPSIVDVHSPYESKHSTRGGSSLRQSSHHHQQQQHHPKDSSSTRSRSPVQRSRHSTSRHRDAGGIDSGGSDGRAAAKSSLDDFSEDSTARKKMERKIQEKEAAYMHRLERWCSRERQQARIYERDSKKKKERKRERDTEAKRLVVFFEKYDDDKYDAKYYKGGSLQKRMRVRKNEQKADDDDRYMESEEIDRLREKLMAENHPEVEAIILRAEQAMHEHLRKRLPLLDFEELPIVHAEMEYTEGEEDDEEEEGQDEEGEDDPHSSGEELAGTAAAAIKTSPRSAIHDSTHEYSRAAASNAAGNFHMDVKDSSIFTASVPSHILESNPFPPHRAVEIKKEPSVQQVDTSSLYPSDVLAAARRGDPESKKIIVKTIIERIPTEKDDLFRFPIQWHGVNNDFIDSRIRPWVDRKINAYVGEDVPSLSKFICEQVLKHESPYAILNDISMVLEEEAEVFVVKMWRLLIYIIEAKNAGLES